MSFSTSATLTLKNDDDFRRVLELVKPDESDTEPQTDEEYRQVMDFLHNLQNLNSVHGWRNIAPASM